VPRRRSTDQDTADHPLERGLPLGPAYEVVEEDELRWAIRCLGGPVRSASVPQPVSGRISRARPREEGGRRPPRRR
jgi:hypothetical protein